MNPVFRATIVLLLCEFFRAIDAASVNVTLSSQVLQNGTPLNLTAVFDPIPSATLFNDLQCGYIREGAAALEILTQFNRPRKNIQLKAGLDPAIKDKLSITSSGNVIDLRISPITFEDEKSTFYCDLSYYDTLDNLLSISSNRTTLESVYSPPVFVEGNSLNSSITLTEGIPSTLQCVVNSRPASAIIWQYDAAINASNASTTAVNGYLTTVKGTLVIHNPTLSMDGKQVQCLASHRYSASINRTTMLSVDYRPVNTTLSASLQPQKPHQILHLSCNATGKPAVTMYRFYLNGTSLGSSTNGSLSIVITDCSKFNGYLKCIPENPRGPGETGQQLLVVNDDIRTSVASALVTLNETANATISCAVYGCPEAAVTWRKNGRRIKLYEKDIKFTRIRNSNAGNYTCLAKNVYSNASSTFQLIVNYKPITTTFTASNMKPIVTTTVIFTCAANSLPVAKYKLYRIDGNGERLVSSPGSETSGTFTVSNIMYANNMFNVTYRCVPFNMLGNGQERTLMLDIQEPPNITEFTIIPRTVNETKNVTVECLARGNPLPIITITGPGSTNVSHSNGRALLTNVSKNQAGAYTCRASNGIGRPVTATTILVVNYVPVIVSLRATPNRTLTGTNSTISCNAQGVPPPHYKLYLINGSTSTLLQNSQAVQYHHSIQYEHFQNYRATYQCVPYNMLGEGVPQSVTVEILVPPKVTVSMSPQTVNRSQSATFSCVVNVASPAATIALFSPRNQSISHVNGSAVLENRTRDDSGSYSCVASNGVEGSPVTKRTTLTVNHEPDQVQITASSKKPANGSHVTLTCTARASPAPRYRFFHVNGSDVRLVADGYSNTYTTPTLDYTMHMNYKSTYRCMPYNMLGNGSTHDVVLDIQVAPVLSFAVTPRTINESQNATVECTVTAANPATNITVRISRENSATVSHVGGIAELVHVTRDQAGTYTCTASNSVGSVSTASSTLTVNHPPDHVQLNSSTLIPRTGSSVTLTCSARSTLSTKFRFVEIKSANRTTVQDGHSQTLTISSINFEHFLNYKAMYQCIAYNMLGDGLSKNVTLDIQVNPRVSTLASIIVNEGQTVNFQCNVIAANPAATVTWRNPSNVGIPTTNGTATLSRVKRHENGTYTCRASSGVGPEATATTSLTVHYGPEWKTNNTILELCLTHNAIFGCSAIGLPLPTVTMYLRGVVIATGSGNARHLISNIRDSQFGDYICIANSTLGTVNITTTLKKQDSPGIVTDVKVAPKEKGFEVTWKLPVCNANIQKIRVDYRRTGQATWQSKTANSNVDTKMTIDNLVEGADYDVRVVVVDSKGLEYAAQAPIVTKTEKPESSSNVALIVGIIGGVIFLIILIVVCYKVLKKREGSSSDENGTGYSHPGAYGHSDKSKSASIKMDDFKDGANQTGPDDAVYANVKKSNAANDANGAIDNANFVADSDGTYDPVDNKQQPKKDENNYAELGSFQSPTANDKQNEKPRAEYSTLEDLGPLKMYEEPENPSKEELEAHKINVEPEPIENSAPGSVNNGDTSAVNIDMI